MKMDNKLKPAIVKIISSPKNFQGRIYSFTSPYQAQYFKKKILMFSIPNYVLSYKDEDISSLQQFDDIEKNWNILFALDCRNLKNQESKNSQQMSGIQRIYHEIAKEQKEKFYFFEFEKIEEQENQTTQQQPNDTKCVIYAVGKEFSKKQFLEIENKQKRRNLTIIKQEIESFIQESMFADLEKLDYEKHLSNETFINTQNKLIVIGITNRKDDQLTIDFLSQFRQLAKFYEYDERYQFLIFDAKDNKLFKWLTTLNMGRYDIPCIIAIQNLSQGIIYRNYEVYNGFNFQNISSNMIDEIKRNVKYPYYTKGFQMIKNVYNLEHWMNNLLSGYMYAIGLVSAIIIPLALLVDTFFKPLMGVGPNSKRKKKVFEDEIKLLESESLKQESKKNN